MRIRFTPVCLAASLVAMMGLPASQQLPAPSKPGIKFSKVIGWPVGRTPAAPAGFDVVAFAEGLDNPRWLYVLPNGDVLVAESKTEKIAGEVPAELMEGLRTSGMLGKSANRITLVRDADRDGKAEVREVFLSGLNQPFGMLLLGRAFYVANTDAVMRFEYRSGCHPPLIAGSQNPGSARRRIQQSLDAKHRREPGRYEAVRHGGIANQRR